ncbi:uncharacterized protein LOC105686951 [Athalia rosae]|uniref:uncharacterized protein LOC105686951 n=1 Tax=Athalia rosae TaxID=37344 RepID=UPI002034744C|nr:uncharacterized protein LOC105686951 [Athalia rosae]
MKSCDFILPLAGLLVAAHAYGDGQVYTREKRQLPSPILVQPFGGVFKFIIGMGIPITVGERLVIYGQNVQFQYPLPTNASYFTNYFSSTSPKRRRRSTSNYERSLAYAMLERQYERTGANGKQCILRGICEVAETPLQEEGLVGELLHLLLTPDYGGINFVEQDYLDAKQAGLRGENCMELFPECPKGHGILDLVSTVEYT